MQLQFNTEGFEEVVRGGNGWYAGLLGRVKVDILAMLIIGIVPPLCIVGGTCHQLMFCKLTGKQTVTSALAPFFRHCQFSKADP